MPLAKSLGKPPREIAQRIVDKLDVTGVAEPLTPASIAGPGFINITLLSQALGDLLSRLDTPELGIPAPSPRQTIVVDLCGINLAKEMHVGHLRATVIGDAIARLFERVGHKVVRQNHVGDWGLNIAMVTGKLMGEAKAGRLDAGKITLPRLTELYQSAQFECAADTAGLEAARRWKMGPKVLAELEAQVSGAEEARAAARAALVKLQSHDPETLTYWRRIFDLTMTECLKVCARLHTRITAEANAGESSYADELAPTIEDLLKRGVAEESDGALIIRLDEFGIEVPCLIRKRDGGLSLRHHRHPGGAPARPDDRRRPRGLRRRRLPSSSTCARSSPPRSRRGTPSRPARRPPRASSTPPSGACSATTARCSAPRSGESVKLTDLLDEAAARAERVVLEKNPDLSEADRQEGLRGRRRHGDQVRRHVRRPHQGTTSSASTAMLAFEGRPLRHVRPGADPQDLPRGRRARHQGRLRERPAPPRGARREEPHLGAPPLPRRRAERGGGPSSRTGCASISSRSVRRSVRSTTSATSSTRRTRRRWRPACDCAPSPSECWRTEWRRSALPRSIGCRRRSASRAALRTAVGAGTAAGPPRPWCSRAGPCPSRGRMPTERRSAVSSRGMTTSALIFRALPAM